MDKATLQLGGNNWAAKDSSLLGYAQGNVSNKYIPREFTFTRASSATRVNQNGLIEKSRENLLLQSNTFSTNWLLAGTSATNGQAGYDGSNDAWELSLTGGNGAIIQFCSESGVNTFSFYAKAGTSNFMMSYIGGVVHQWAYFDIANGITGFQNGITSSIESVGNGWYRCSFTVSGTIHNVRIQIADSISTVGTSTSGTIYIQDAQLEPGLVATEYLETTSTTTKAGIVENLPRIDYSNGKGSLLLEPQRTNLVSQSEYFSGWIQNNIIINSNATISPDGSLNASKIIGNTTTGSHLIYKSLGTTINNGTVTVFAKAGEYDNLRIIEVGNYHYYASFDLTNGNISATGGFHFISANTTYFGNGWYRCEIVTDKTSFGALSFGGFPDGFEPTNTPANYTGDGFSGIYIWGAQVEEGSYATSYIPTYGTSVTRVVDDCDFNNAESLIGQNEGTLFLDWTHKLNDEEYSMMGFQDGADHNRVQFILNAAGVSRFGVAYRVNNIMHYFNANLQLLNIDQRYKAAIVYTPTAFKVFLDGVQVRNITGLTASNGYFNQVAFAYKTGQNTFATNMPVHKTLVFKTALSDAECITLTTI